MSFWRTKKFNKLKEEWYRKLENEGFVDAELTESRLHVDTAKFQDRDAIMGFYDRVTNYFYNAAFEPKIEKAVLMYYSEGLSIREIAIILKRSRPMVTRILAKHLKAMGEVDYERHLE